MVSSDEKQWDAFNIDQEGGGIAAVNLMAKQYSSFQLANTILSQRTNPDNKFKVIHKNAIWNNWKRGMWNTFAKTESEQLKNEIGKIENMCKQLLGENEN